MALTSPPGITSPGHLFWRPPISLSRVIGPESRLAGRQFPGQCEERFFSQTLDHFRHVPGEADATFQQRYFVCDEYWAPARRDGEDSVVEGRGCGDAPLDAKGPIFFYAGNEADVSLYIGATGLMWENAPAFNALLVFAEHRFYGESLPFGAFDKGRELLSTSQALADYAFLLTALKRDLLPGAEASPVIVFGGSYGGMLAAWLRMKYPHVVDGAIAASAPIFAFSGLRNPSPDPEAFAEITTRAAGPSGGAAHECSANVRRAFSAILSGDERRRDSEEALLEIQGVTNEETVRPGGTARSERRGDDDGTAHVARLLHVCPGSEPQGEGAREALAYWVKSAFDYLAMGNYPYPTGYILFDGDGTVTLPAWPLRAACSHLSDPGLEVADEDVLLSALAEAIGVYYNATGDLPCFSPSAGATNESAIDEANWNWQACTEMEMPMSTDGVRDMFWSAAWDPEAQATGCWEQFGVKPTRAWGAVEFGGIDVWSQVSNVVFSNGRLDPWSGYGVLDQSEVGPGIEVIVMDQAAHHLDLFFSDADDPDEVQEARRREMDLVEGWVRQGYHRALSWRAVA